MKKFGKLLLVYYHPIIFDLAQTFQNLFDVEIAVNQNLKDNYGGATDVVEKAAARGLRCLYLQQALANIRLKNYQLVGCDGVFDGDKLIMNVCENNKVPWFAINGYPHNEDEPSKNILSFSWYMPQKRYRGMFPSEGHIKEVDWKDLANNNRREKNIFVYYPEMKECKDYAWGNRNSLHIKDNNRVRYGAVSLIHRYEECNKWCYEVFKSVKEKSGLDIQNDTSKSAQEVYESLMNSNLLLHLKHGDCPGISVLEAMILGAVPVVAKNFVLASHNQELLINNYSAFVCDTVDEIIDVCVANYKELQNPELRISTFEHVNMLTSFRRQRAGLERFFETCLND